MVKNDVGSGTLFQMNYCGGCCFLCVSEIHQGSTTPPRISFFIDKKNSNRYVHWLSFLFCNFAGDYVECKIINAMTGFNELLRNRRSIRKYKDQPVDEEKLQLILQAALMSPASKRSNGWEFIVVDDKSMLQKLSECREAGSKLLANAPMAIVVCADPDKSDVWFEDASISAIILQLAASDLGLGSCWVQVYKRMYSESVTSGEYIKGLLNIPSHLEVLNIVSLGYKDEERKPYDLEKLSYDKIHRGSF